jgi:hypothetical protein
MEDDQNDMVVYVEHYPWGVLSSWWWASGKFITCYMHMGGKAWQPSKT